jgi:hypothetical protein
MTAHTDVAQPNDGQRIVDAINDVNNRRADKIELTLKNGAPLKVYGVGSNVVRLDVKTQ